MIIKELGKGAYGTVNQVINIKTKKEYAMKELAKFQIMRLGKRQLDAIFRERDYLEKTSSVI